MKSSQIISTLKLYPYRNVYMYKDGTRILVTRKAVRSWISTFPYKDFTGFVIRYNRIFNNLTIFSLKDISELALKGEPTE